MPIRPENRALNGQNRFLNEKARAARLARGAPMQCAQCSATFAPYLNKRARFCSRKCRKRAACAATKKPKVCAHCAKHFVPAKSMKLSYCSKLCRSRARLAAIKASAARSANAAETRRRYGRSEAYRMNQANHKAKRRSAERTGTVTRLEWVSILQRYNMSCAYCGVSGVKLTVDHVVALSRGGRHEPSNVVPACRACNSAKRDRDWTEKLRCPLANTI